MTTTTPTQLPALRSRLRVWGGRALMATSGGLLLGVPTSLVHGWLSGAWSQIANSDAVWSAVAFAAGALLYRQGPLAQAALGGLGEEVILIVGYYGYAELRRDGRGTFPSLSYGSAWPSWRGPCSVSRATGGGAAGTHARRLISRAALAGLFGMEGIAYAWDLN